MRKKRQAATYRRVNPPRNMSNTVGLAASTDEARFVLTHVHTENGQRVATDGFRLHAEPCKKTVCKVCEAADPKEPRYPNYHEIVKLAYGDKMQIIKVDYMELRSALVRCGLFSNPRDFKHNTRHLSADHQPTMAVYIEHFADHIHLWGYDKDIKNNKGKVLYHGLGTTRNVIEADLDSSTKRFDFSVRFDYMIDAIDHVGPGTIKIQQKNPNSPLIITGKKKDVFALLMPMSVPKDFDKPALLGNYTDEVKTGFVGKEYGTISPSHEYNSAYKGKESPYKAIQSKPRENAVEYVIPDNGIDVTQYEMNNGDKLPQGHIELVGQATIVGSKPKPENKPILSLMEQVVGLASGTIATLIDRTDYETIDKVHAEFIEYCKSPAAEGILTWSAAWEKFSDASRFLERFSDEPINPEPPAQDDTDEFEINVKVEYDRNWTWLYFDDESNEYIRQAEDIRAAFKAVGGKFTNRRNGDQKAWYFMDKLDFETVENLLMGNIPVEIPETINA